MHAPQSGSYDPVFASYLAELPEGELSALLTAQAAALATLLAGLTEAQGQSRYAPGKWTIKEVLAHVIDAERIFAYRALCFARGEAHSLPGFDEDHYAAHSHANARSLANLGADFAAARAATLALLRSLSPSVYDLPGQANGRRLTVRSCLFVLAGHAEHHLCVLRTRYLTA